MPSDVEILSFGEPMVEFAATEHLGLAAAPAFQRLWGGDTSTATGLGCVAPIPRRAAVEVVLVAKGWATPSRGVAVP
jgi:hypothetical protein